tara:strand:+ start:304 stop:489 length:186 start_codon:yes stop_codon:yes gene_type:complete
MGRIVYTNDPNYHQSIYRRLIMSTKNFETLTALILMLNDHLDNGEYDKATIVAKILQRIEL